MGEINQSYKRAINLTIHNLKEEAKKEKQDNNAIFDLYLDLQACVQYGFLYDTDNKDYYKKYSDYIKEIALDRVTDDKKHAEKWRNLYWTIVKLESFWFFESFLIYMEHKRPYEKRFYEPRAKTLKTVVDDLQKLEFSGPEQILYALSMPARVGKSTTMVFYGAWHCLRHPLSHSAMGTHSGMLADHFYKETLDIFETDDYCFKELYSFFQPDKKFIEDKSAEKMTISFGSKGDFPSCLFRGIDGSWTGAVDISGGQTYKDDFGILFIDDLVRDRTHSLSPKRMNDTFAEMLNKMFDRMNDGAKVVLIGTLWNVLDPIKRLEEMYSNDPRYVFRKIPALNENDESNFDYEVKGFSTQYYHEMRDRLIRAGNEAEWFAKYMQAPYVREGILLPLDQLGYFNGILPVGHKFRFVVNCDVAFGGGDSVSMPIGLQDKTDDIVYIVDWYFNSSGVSVTVPGVVDMIIKHGIKNVTFEANAGGNLYASKVQEELRNRNYLCSCDSVRAPNNASKEDKIKACEGVIRQKFRFLDSTKHNPDEFDEETTIYERSAEYGRALEEMSTYVTIGKNLHDDAIDSISQIAERVFDTMQRRTVIMDCPF
jgi:hypothetical protein